MNARVHHWVKAARPLSLGNIWPPALAGWFLATDAGAAGGSGWLLLLLVACWLDQLAIVFLNEVADQAADRLNPRPTLFSGGSRVLVDALIPAATLRRAGLLAASGFLGLCLLAGLLLGDWRAPALALAGIALLHAYSFRPLRLNYEGGGELLQASGVAFVLPGLGLLLAGGTWGLLAPDEWLGLFLLAMPGALGSTLTDAPADRLAGKETLAARFGTSAAALLGLASGCTALGLLADRFSPLGFWSLVTLLGLLLLQRAAFKVWRLPESEAAHGWNRLSAQLLLVFTMLGWLGLGPLSSI